ncbi:M23 family metallopeptidase [Pseudoalteromonas umbrosa]|uniref:M23 family metallopeptidase n=1 Tax=Pseudoalteromonas umbrosa TaxID=3048489 RepID=UPI0024C2614C|nr:M23 family metallopeptidase [Pseudoalteromonas sp. B95]MDK1288876.1 M23 family metallopeptidase [Pseudoalteromonas sp. B95]
MKSPINKVAAALPVLLFASITAHAEGQHLDITPFYFNQQTLQKLAINPLIQVDETQFIFTNELLNEDWSAFLYSEAPHLIEYQEALLHWAGYTSINPKLLLALMEHASQLISTPSEKSLLKPFANWSEKTGFSQQLEDVALQLNQRFYAFEEHTSNHSTIKSNAATVALSSLLGNAQALALFASQYKLLMSNDLFSPKETSFVSTNNIPNNGFSMNLPWPSGYSWTSGGAHSNTGSGYPYSSLDFNNGSGGWGSNTPWVQASHEGRVTRYSACNIRITHPSGYATQYYHMDNLQFSSGDYVSAGAWLGRYANNRNMALCQGGQSSGPHVHFSLLYNGRFVSLHNAYISGYRIDVGNYNYDSNCYRFYFEKNGYKTCAWSRLYH